MKLQKMIYLSKEMDKDDELDDFIICDSMENYHIQKKQKYERSSKTNQSWVPIHEAPPGLNDDVGKEFRLKFIKSNGNYKYLYAEGKYGSVWHCIEHSNCQNRYRVGKCKKHNLRKVSKDNQPHSSGMIQPKSGIQINIKNEVSFIIFYLLFFIFIYISHFYYR